MLDVYRNYYGLTGEPFRLGPDHRFSLHHESYANAKAYLEYAIFQGEGFIAITGAPGTGKTTLINEILAELDRDKVQVATLISTQIESRDLLQMVASSFDLHPEDASKANLLVEIESFLVRKIRDGQRAILIVDEAQGLSKNALEELRLLANLQYRYQLLLQIFLVGQEKLLELISEPEMEHLQQRLVAAASLEALSFDESIDYIEHRLSRVGWKGDPAIDEGALCEIYRYSGGVPRRINLITNRLFLQGGLEQKHSFNADDTKDVIKGLIEEFLLSPEPLVSETELAAATGPGGTGRSRSLPRDNPDSAKAAQSVSGGNRNPEPGSQSADNAQESTTQNRTAKTAGEAAENNDPIPFPGGRQTEPGASSVAPKPAPAMEARRRPASMERPVPPRSASGTLTRLIKKGDVKSIALFAILVLGAVYLLLEPTDDKRLDAKPAQVAEVVTQQQPEPSQALDSEMENTTVEPAEEAPPTDGPEASLVDAGTGKPLVQEENSQGKVVRELLPETGNKVAEAEPLPGEVLPGVVRKPAINAETRAPAPPEKSAIPVTPVKPVVKVEPVPQPKPVVSKAVTSSKPEAPASVEQPVEPRNKPDVSTVQSQLSRLKQEAEQRFATRRAQEKEKAVPAAPKPVVPAKETSRPVTPPVPSPVKQQRLTPEETIATLLEGSWSSRGKPASLLPSDTTFCNRRGNTISCKSVPQNIKTRYGLALYKVETTLSGFSPQGHFEVSYRTLVRLVGEAGESKRPVPDSDEWQISTYSMSCTLSGARQVSCVDGKGVVREYLKTGPVRTQR